MARHPRPVLTPARMRMLELLRRDGVQPSICFGRTADECVQLGWAQWVEMPDRAFPSIEITSTGRAALGTT